MPVVLVTVRTVFLSLGSPVSLLSVGELSRAIGGHEIIKLEVIVRILQGTSKNCHPLALAKLAGPYETYSRTDFLMVRWQSTGGLCPIFRGALQSEEDLGWGCQPPMGSGPVYQETLSQPSPFSMRPGRAGPG